MKVHRLQVQKHSHHRHHNVNHQNHRKLAMCLQRVQLQAAQQWQPVQQTQQRYWVAAKTVFESAELFRPDFEQAVAVRLTLAVRQRPTFRLAVMVGMLIDAAHTSQNLALA